MIEVKRSEIHGRGSFAKKTIRAGTSFNCPSYRTKKETWTSVNHDDEIYELHAPYKFLNHSDEANAELYLAADGCWTLYILQQVAKDDEITIDYGEDWEP